MIANKITSFLLRVFKRILNEPNTAKISAIGLLPVPESINVEGLDLDCKLEDMLSVDKKFWIKEANEIKDYFDEYVNDSMPKEITDEVNHLIQRVNEMN